MLPLRSLRLRTHSTTVHWPKTQSTQHNSALAYQYTASQLTPSWKVTEDDLFCTRSTIQKLILTLLNAIQRHEIKVPFLAQEETASLGATKKDTAMPLPKN